MNGYQPKKTCENCLDYVWCDKGKNGKRACKQYNPIDPPPPPNSGSCVIPPKKTSPTKQRTVLSVRDFSILYNITNMHIDKLEYDARRNAYGQRTEAARIKQECANMEALQRNTFYQDLLRIREKLGELNIEVETPSVEVEE